MGGEEALEGERPDAESIDGSKVPYANGVKTRKASDSVEKDSGERDAQRERGCSGVAHGMTRRMVAVRKRKTEMKRIMKGSSDCGAGVGASADGGRDSVGP